ncbi:Fur-regulated basic protein FbpA [Priestia endophytica]|uniref:Fur-regulated basic protein FbpA n=1 Tax=Priestia endophytica TaxID=135735 RepID=UPI0015587C38|nr:Fur-regulated basic protein FbpA [Priestia endophytica]
MGATGCEKIQLKGAVEKRKKKLIQQIIFEKGYIKEEYREQLYELTLSELEALYVKYAKEEFFINCEEKK